MHHPFPVPRRSFRYSLRGLLMLVSIIALLLGWQANIVHRRRAAIERIEQNGGAVCVWHRLDTSHMLCGVYAASYAACGEVRVPTLRAWLGDEPIETVLVRSEADLRIARACFPEAEVVHFNADGEILGMFEATIAPAPFRP